ncbi:hypothetical protein KR054_011809 [Drosophila jambulina]|nr:hypothetical protein KR054_011809 [Drosophila jambulina]
MIMVHCSTHECGLLDVQPMSTKASKKQPAKADACKKCNRTKPRKPTLEELLANDVTSQPHVLMLESQADEKRNKKKKSPAEPECPEPQDQGSSDSPDEVGSCLTQDKVSSGESQDESGPQTTANNGEEKPNCDGAKTAGCTNNCWMRCPIPWSCCYSPCNRPCNSPCIGPCSPCNGRFFYCGNCCNGCRRCCNYRCNPCGGYCCSRPSAGMTKCNKYPTELKDKLECGKGTHKRKKGGACCCILPTEPTLGFPSPSTMPGYSPTVPPQYNSPYSGHWHAGEVASNPMSSNENTMKSYTRH